MPKYGQRILKGIKRQALPKGLPASRAVGGLRAPRPGARTAIRLSKKMTFARPTKTHF